jgi:hypothetical protein
MLPRHNNPNLVLDVALPDDRWASQPLILWLHPSLLKLRLDLAW